MAYTGYNGEDVVSKAMLDQLYSLTQEYTSIALKLSAAEGDREAALTSWMETTDNAQALKLRQTIENATAKLREMAEKNVQQEQLSDEEKGKLSTELGVYKDKINSGYGVVRNLIDNLSSDPDGVAAALESIDNPVKSNRGRKPGTAGSGLPRLSARVTVRGGNFDAEDAVNEFDTFSAAANALSVDVKDLQLAFAEAAGVKHEEISSVKKPIVFEFQAHENGPVYQLETKPKPRQKPGPKGDSKPAQTEAAPANNEPPTNTEAA